MALLDRVLERVETDLDETELQLMIDEALAEIETRHGPNADPAKPLTVLIDGNRRRLVLARPIDPAESITVTEITGETETVVAASGYRLRSGGRVLERIGADWAGLVEIAYVPVNDGDRRQEIAIKLVQLAIEFSAAQRERVGDVDVTYRDHHQERAKLLRSLALPLPR
jgi:hypothetical protein